MTESITFVHSLGADRDFEQADFQRCVRSSRREPGEPSRPALTPSRPRHGEAASVSWPEPPARHLSPERPADAGGFSVLRAIAAGLQAGDLCRALYSPSGKLRGPSRHPAESLLQDDRGHEMLFRTFDGSLPLVVHRCFSLPKTRVQIWNLPDEGHRLSLGTQLLGCE